MSPRHFYLELYNIDIFYFIHWKPEKFKKYCMEKYWFSVAASDARAETTFVYDGIKRKCILIWVRPGQDVQTAMMHECIHAVNYIHDYVGIKADHQNDEASAYLAELIYKKSRGK